MFKKLILFNFFFFLFSFSTFAADSIFRNVPVHTCFSPKGTCENDIVNVFNVASQEIKISAYSFTSPKIAQALCEAQKRQVEVKVILDKSQLKAQGSKYQFLKDCGIDIKIDNKHSIMHNKVLIVDLKIIGTGSFNYTLSAQNNNAENYNIIGSKSNPVPKKWMVEYLRNWELHFSHSN